MHLVSQAREFLIKTKLKMIRSDLNNLQRSSITTTVPHQRALTDCPTVTTHVACLDGQSLHRCLKATEQTYVCLVLVSSRRLLLQSRCWASAINLSCLLMSSLLLPPNRLKQAAQPLPIWLMISNRRRQKLTRRSRASYCWRRTGHSVLSRKPQVNLWFHHKSKF